VEFHEVANLFPMMAEDEFASLVDDIRESGLREPIWTHEDKIIDGRNRYLACRQAQVSPRFREWDGNGSLVQFVVSLNLKRRHLSSSQKAMVATDMLLLLEEEAKRRQGTRTDLRPNLVEIIPQSHGKSREQAAVIVGTNDRYISDAKHIKKNAPEVAARVREGKMTLPEAKSLTKMPETQRKAVMSKLDTGQAKNVKEAEKAVRREERQQVAEAAEVVVEKPSTIHVQPGQWYKLGRHHLYCGDTSEERFWQHLPSAAFAFADPPYNAEVAEWDSGFEWQHDWLMSKSPIVAVTPGIEGLFNFARVTGMPYKWSLSCWIDNGMTRGALGFGNWIYVALFAAGSIHRNAQDFVRVSIKASENDETRHKGRKPSALLAWLLDTFTHPGGAVIDPFLGSGTTLLVAEAAGRTCHGGELSPEFCQDIIARWETQTGQKAEVMTRG
jgi:hypothetical protein